MPTIRASVFFLFVLFFVPLSVAAQTLEKQLLSEDAKSLTADALAKGDAKRGAVLFYQPFMACIKCHLPDGKDAALGNAALGPNLARLGEKVSNEQLVESVLLPSKVIRKEFVPVTLLLLSGKSLTGLVVKESATEIIIRNAGDGFREVAVAKKEIDERVGGNVSIMPAGQVNILASRQQFLDLLRYLIEIRDGGPKRARELEPAPALYAARPLPEYEKKIDHAGMIRSLDNDSFKRGSAIYNRLCVNCHGTHDRPGSLPTSLRFASGKFRNGSDPYTMYQTLTRGFGMMVPQAWMVPEQKYDVIHYIREAYLKEHNPSQLFLIDDFYLAGLPKGDTRGPKPSNILPWEQMDYGPNLIATYEVGEDGKNFAYKGNAVRLDAGPGGVAKGRNWSVFDTDTMRLAAAWSGKGFIDWNGINFNGRHGIHPRIAGDVQVANSTGPGWANPKTGSFDDDQRVVGRDGRRYGPLPRHWAHYQGMYAYGHRTILKYTVGTAQILEMPGVNTETDNTFVLRSFNIGKRDRDLVLQVANSTENSVLSELQLAENSSEAVLFGPPQEAATNSATPEDSFQFDGTSYVELSKPHDFDLHSKDFTVTARIRTTKGGTIFAKAKPDSKWTANGKAFFVRGGRLCYDIGWVGVVQSRTKVADGKWHDVAVSYEAEGELVRLYIDGKPEGTEELRPKKPVRGHVVRIGYAAENFPERQSLFVGDISEVRFYQQLLSHREINANTDAEGFIGHWDFSGNSNETVTDNSQNNHEGRFISSSTVPSKSSSTNLVAGVTGNYGGVKWESDQTGCLRLRIPAGTSPLKFVLWTTRVDRDEDATSAIRPPQIDRTHLDLEQYTAGGPLRWQHVLKTQASVEKTEGPFAVDTLTHPAENPWFCRMRLTGFDFFDDGDRVAVSDWDGNIWLVSGLSQLDATDTSTGGQVELSWRRIASGLFQPLGVKIIRGTIHVTCRDQLCVLHDLNDDGEIDYYENLNNDHQVTEHFHEFAMGLQVDESGNFYYAKSARHALPAVVPHHGTLLRISQDGSRTEILANGFRAANGVCLNSDGTFIVTDQEGHWNPKNRINWVREGGFYGNMFGYHDVTDSSDEAMKQPLCWITNEFDRSPAELLWVESEKWGALNGSLLNLSYGYGQAYIVPFEEVNGQKQGGMCALPIPRLPTGIMRGRFHPTDGQLYVCGMFSWAGSQQQPGGFYRIRYTGKPAHLPIGINARPNGVAVTFSEPLDKDSATDPERFHVKTWSLKRTANYGSKHYDERELKITNAVLSADGRQILLEIPEIEPTWCMEIGYSLKGANGESVKGRIHNTIHHLGK